MPYDPSLYRRRNDVDRARDAHPVPWSTWDAATPGPEPRPDWVVTSAGAVDTDLGVLKTGKEADVHLLRRGVPGTVGCLLAAKRYRDADHRLFQRDAGYQEGRRVRRSRDTRAMARGTAYGKEVTAGRWAGAEFDALCRLWSAGVAVPYPVQLLGTELLLEFVGDADGTAAPRLAGCRPPRRLLAELWAQCVEAMTAMAREGYAHGDLSAFNLLVQGERLVVIDVPQIVDLVMNPQGVWFLERDCRNVCTWFASRGLAVDAPQELVGDLMAQAAAGW